ncbi:saccharopine dehydrogenase family protein [Yinghuangia soli]|uniref:Saccharopine dehydrogenase NADP-binding domain-containing protein n=1 Tax=Yinghuangia soli TaxID=2908204 RepID=A0AA41TZH5_9ACTN|nr:saccharopine dehydrogenase family protein [Yinghuangia soli]MCF2528823.1 saccharopine dehydrogenase NADP-binding domain-containing protein [Yinghuangia soli]
MSADRTPAGSTVHWIGTGLSTGRTGLRLVCDRAARVVLWDRTADRGEMRLAALGLAGRAEVRALDRGALEAEVKAGDVVVSMLPATEHPELLRLAVARGAHFACTSYTSEALAAQAAEAAAAGLVVLTESGLDPGIDHLMAHDLVARARRAVGDGAAEVALTSYCGGIPAEPDEFCYRFSWAPYGVLAALGSPAQYIEDGEARTARHPWEAARPLVLAGEAFEVYPNRDSLPFAAQYGLPDAWRPTTLIRGTLRNAGWRAAWGEVFDTVLTGDETRIRALAKELADRYPTTEADRDRVVLAVELTVRDTSGGVRWRGSHLLDLTGDAAESAMARCVAVPLALGVARILDGALPPGLNRAAEDAGQAAAWLEFLARHGIRGTFDDTLPDPSEDSS